MSSRRIVASCVAMGAIVVTGGWYGVAAFPLRAVSAPRPGLVSAAGNSGVPQTETAASRAQGQPRDLRPGDPRPASRREMELQTAIAAQPTLNGFLELARLQEERGAITEAEATLVQARSALPAERGVLMALSGLYNRMGQFDETVEMLEQGAAMSPSDASAQHLIAIFYEEKVRKDTSLSPADRGRHIQSGIAAEDRALALTPDYVDALIIKNILLRHQANLETNPATRMQLIAEADQIRSHAIELQKTRRLSPGGGQPGIAVSAVDAGAPPPPPPPPPPPGSASLVDGQAPVRVGGNIKQPTKTLNVAPVYPPDAMAARVQGVVIIEATVDTAGSVRDTRVLRSIPMLDQAAVDAVSQWQFTPTVMNDQPVPVIMTVTVNFTLQ